MKGKETSEILTLKNMEEKHVKFGNY